MAALEGQRGLLGDDVVEQALAPLRARLTALGQPAGLRHRQVTVLFADVAGSTAMAHRMEAEDALDVLGSAMERMAAVVERHQGRVLRFTGDGIKAAFGMDLAREDDAERAVRAGLAILQAAHELAETARRRHGLSDFAVRVGVHTGDVALGAGIDATNTAIGASVNVAARMEQTAPPGGLRISHDTWLHVRGLFDVEPQEPLEVKGVALPMSTYLVRAARDRRVASVERGLQGLQTPMVGRQQELQQLLDVVARARETRQGQVLTLAGEAGLGKSRLVRELLPALQDCRVIALRLQPDAMLRPWGLLRSLLALQCGVSDTDSAEVACRKVVDTLAPSFESDGEARAQRIGQLAGLDFAGSPHVQGLDPRTLRDEAWAALRDYLRALAGDGGARPVLPALVVLLVEDLHWADDSSLDLLQHLHEQAAGLPLALLMTARPALFTRRPDWCPGGTRTWLGPLSAGHGEALAAALLQRIGTVPRALAELIVGRAEGNPYYMEELVRRLIDDGVIVVGEPHWTVQLERLRTVQLPVTLVGLLQARLDALPAAERQAARHASVVGPVFWDDALQAVNPAAPQALPALQQAAFVREHATSDFDGTPERQFDHHLLHQVTYDTLLKAERRLGHGAVARWLAERTQGRGGEFLAMTGEHAERAGETALAIDCFEQAADEAWRRYANSAAAAWLRRALTLLGEDDPPRRFALLGRAESLAYGTGDLVTQERCLAEIATLLDHHPDETRRARWTYDMATLADRRGDTAAFERLSRQACALAESAGAARTAALAHGLLAWLHLARHQHDEAAAHVAAGQHWVARSEADAERGTIEAQLLLGSGRIEMARCRFDAASAAMHELEQRSRALGVPGLRLGALHALCTAAAMRGRWDEATEAAERMRALAVEMARQPPEAHALQALAEAAHARGDGPTAATWCAQSLALFRQVEQPREQAKLMRLQATLQLERGDIAEALDTLLATQSLHARLDEAMAVESGSTDALVAWCRLQLGQTDEARRDADAVLAVFGIEGRGHPPHDTLELRWRCLQVLDALDDARAPALLDRLHHDVLERAAMLGEGDERKRVIDALPIFREVVAAHARRHGRQQAVPDGR